LRSRALGLFAAAGAAGSIETANSLTLWSLGADTGASDLVRPCLRERSYRTPAPSVVDRPRWASRQHWSWRQRRCDRGAQLRHAWVRVHRRRSRRGRLRYLMAPWVWPRCAGTSSPPSCELILHRGPRRRPASWQPPTRPVGDTPQRSGKPDVRDGVRCLAAKARLEIGHEVEATAIVGAVVQPAQRHDAVGVVAPAQRARDHVRRVDRRRDAAGDASLPSDLVALGVRRP
jgi:hypothetical protein